VTSSRTQQAYRVVVMETHQRLRKVREQLAGLTAIDPSGGLKYIGPPNRQREGCPPVRDDLARIRHRKRKAARAARRHNR
jgi:hypothetical protein